MRTEISRSHCTTRGNVHTGISQKGDGPTIDLEELPRSPFFMRIYFQKTIIFHIYFARHLLFHIFCLDS